jgi:hypothetical protein
MEIESMGKAMLGIENTMSHGEALGNTGGVQTTTLEAKINGTYVGKFDNRSGLMSNGANIDKNTVGNGYPAECKKYWVDGHGTHNKGKPHAEDYLLAKLAQEHERLGGQWHLAYPRAEGQDFDLLSIKTDKSACPNCARNLLRFASARGLKLREKSSILHTGTSVTSHRTGAQILNAGKGHGGAVPVRHWTVAKLESYISRQNKVITNSQPVWTFRGHNIASTNNFPMGGNAELGWSGMGYGRKSNRGNW